MVWRASGWHKLVDCILLAEDDPGHLNPEQALLRGPLYKVNL